MAKTNISWTDQTWNPIVGCSIVSPGCTNCYAMRMAARLERMGNAPQYNGLTKKVNGNVVWTGKVALAEKALLKPLKRRKPTLFFVNSMGDLFHEDVPDEWIDQVFAVMALCPQHIFQVLTKRAERMREYMASAERRIMDSVCDLTIDLELKVALAATPESEAKASSFGITVVRLYEWPLPNVWLGVSAEDQTRADERIPLLLDTPAAIRFVSCEPLLGSVDIRRYLPRLDVRAAGLENDPLAASMLDQAIAEGTASGPMEGGLGWVIVGGESGPNARPMHPQWARDLRDQCVAAGTPFHFKQHGAYLHESQDPNALWDWSEADERNVLHHWPDGTTSLPLAKKNTGRHLDGRTWDGMPVSAATDNSE